MIENPTQLNTRWAGGGWAGFAILLHWILGFVIRDILPLPFFRISDAHIQWCRIANPTQLMQQNDDTGLLRPERGSEQLARGSALGMWATYKRPERAKALLPNRECWLLILGVPLSCCHFVASQMVVFYQKFPWNILLINTKQREIIVNFFNIWKLRKSQEITLVTRW